MSQYFSGAFFPELVQNKSKIYGMVKDFFATVRDKVQLDPGDYVMDLAIDLPNNKVYVIELNPGGPPDGHGTGTPLFDLSKELDRAILFGENQSDGNETDDFEFRIRTSPPTEKLSSLVNDGPLRKWLKENGHL